MIVSRGITRILLNDTEETQTLKDPNTGTIAFVLTTADAVYIGHRDRFMARHFQMGVANTNSVTLTVGYYNGTNFTSEVDDLIDETQGFTQDGFISWTNKTDWQMVALKDVVPTVNFDEDIELFWVKITVSGSLSAGTTLQSVLNLYCNDNTMRIYYPEIISDTSYLPSGRTHFIDQYIGAKNMVVNRLKQRGVIRHEGQIVDYNQVVQAASHAAAYLILNPIASNEVTRLLRDDAYLDFGRETKDLNFNVDEDEDGVLDPIERDDARTVVSLNRI